jgi:DNA primase
VVGETVQLKKAGTTLKGLCPFHGEKTASFIVTPARETWHCFGCGEGGDIFSFVMRRDGIAFPEALRRLAQRAGVEIDERTSREDARRKRLHEVLDTAFAFYHAVLMNSETGAPALAYLRGRGFTDETIERAQLGFAPPDWDALVRTLERKRQIGAAELTEVGLAMPRRSGRGVYDRFRGRVMFPIRDATGNATGLGGRIMPAPPPTAAETTGLAASTSGIAADQPARGAASVPDSVAPSMPSAGSAAEPAARSRPDAAPAPTAAARTAAQPAAQPTPDPDGPKYLNSPATPLFDKSRTLYPLDRAKASIRKSGIAVIVEGYTDALMAHQAGFDNVVASLGTALTPGQVALLTRYAAKKIVLAYDVDPAGERAGTLGVTALEQLTRQLAATDAGVELDEVRVARLPDGKDPDEVIRETPDAWREAIRTAAPIVEYLIDFHARTADLRTTGGRARFIDLILPTLRTVRNPVLRDGYLQRLRQVSGVEERVLLESLHRSPEAPRGGSFGAGGGAGESRISAASVLASPDAFDPKAVLRAIDPVERDLLRFLLSVPETQEATAERLAPTDLPSQPARELWTAMRAVRADPPYTTERVFARLATDPETQALLVALLERRDAGTDAGTTDLRVASQGIEQCLLRLELDRLEERTRWTRVELGEAERANDRPAIERLMTQEQHHNETRKSLQRRMEQASLLSRPAAARAAGGRS